MKIFKSGTNVIKVGILNGGLSSNPSVAFVVLLVVADEDVVFVTGDEAYHAIDSW